MTRSAKGTAEQPGRNVRAKAGLNREISRSGWGLLVRRLEDKAPGRVEKVPPAYTSQRCSACGHVDGRSRESQARFRCTACGYAGNADVNAARNIAAGHAVKARGGDGASRPVNREPQLLASYARSWNPPPSGEGGCRTPDHRPSGQEISSVGEPCHTGRPARSRRVDDGVRRRLPDARHHAARPRRRLGRASMTVRDDMVNGYGICHGGMIFSLADTTFACACNSWGPVTVAARATSSSSPRPGSATSGRRVPGARPLRPQRRLRRRRHPRRATSSPSSAAAATSSAPPAGGMKIKPAKTSRPNGPAATLARADRPVRS